MPTTFAVLSDIHANLPALEAVLADIDARLSRAEVDTVYYLGDLVSYATWTNEVVTTIRGRGIPTIAGNYDEGIGLLQRQRRFRPDAFGFDRAMVALDLAV